MKLINSLRLIPLLFVLVRVGAVETVVPEALNCAEDQGKRDERVEQIESPDSSEDSEMYTDYLIGLMYYYGIKVPQNYQIAFEELTKSAEKGFHYAQNQLGVLYANGEGVPQNFEEAAKWYKAAAEQGNVSGQLALGTAYSRGEGVPRDFIQAYLWLDLAVANGFEKAEHAKSELIKSMTPEQIEKAQKLAQEWYAKYQAKD